MRRLAIALILTSLAWVVGAALLASPASATTVPPDSTETTDPSGAGPLDADELAPVDVLQVSGLFDQVLVNSIKDAISRSEGNGSQALILQLNTTGAVISRAR